MYERWILDNFLEINSEPLSDRWNWSVSGSSLFPLFLAEKKGLPSIHGVGWTQNNTNFHLCFLSFLSVVEPGLANPPISWNLAMYSADSFQIYPLQPTMVLVYLLPSNALLVHVCHFHFWKLLLKMISIVILAQKSISTHFRYRKEKKRKQGSFTLIIQKKYGDHILLKQIQNMFSTGTNTMSSFQVQAELHGYNSP